MKLEVQEVQERHRSRFHSLRRMKGSSPGMEEEKQQSKALEQE